MASPTQWTWVWVGCGSWWWTGRPGVLQPMGSQRVGHDWVTELNWRKKWEDFQPKKTTGLNNFGEKLYQTFLKQGIREGNGTPLQYSCLENPMNGGAWWAVVHGVAKSQTRLSNFTFTFHFPALEKEMATHSLQCSCLENPRDGGAWWAAIYGVAQSRMRLKWLSSLAAVKLKRVSMNTDAKILNTMLKNLFQNCNKEVQKQVCFISGTAEQFNIVTVSLLTHVWLFMDPKEYSPPGPSVHGISQARILEWVAISFTRISSQPWDQTHISCIGRQIFLSLSHQGSPFNIKTFIKVEKSHHIQWCRKGNHIPDKNLR